MNVAVVNESLPYPASAGNRIRTLNLLLKLARRHKITYICRGGDDAESTRRGIEFLADHHIQAVAVEGVMPRRRGVRLYTEALANLLSPLPYAVAAHRSRQVQRAVLQCALASRIDLWQFEWLAYADALRGVAGARRLVIAHNVESLIWQRYLANERNPLKRAYFWNQWRKYCRFERRVFREVDGVVCVSAADEALARAEFNIGHTAVVDNGVDCHHFEAQPRQPEPATILFLGSLEWRPNQDALRLFFSDILPHLVQRRRDLKVQIVGRNPPEWLRAQANATPCVEVIPNVPDVRPYLARASVMTVPLRIGGGSRLKILEAMAAGTPVVSSAVGCEGLAVRDGVHLHVADDPSAHADALLRCIDAPDDSLPLTAAARRLARDQYDWEALARRLEAVWEDLVRYRLEPRASATVKASEPALTPAVAIQPLINDFKAAKPL
jgi:glycosyltransferase involved in cell wall biosynthesis